MSATDELRRLLDGRGVEYETRDGKAIKNTYWNDSSDRRWGYTSDESGEIKDLQLFLVRGRMDVSPEQAVEATLGSDLKAENAELRELLQRTWDAFHDAPAREFFYVKNKLRELGIEVDA